jgi:hypothetical protein
MHEYECQQSVNDCLPSKMVNYSAMWLLLSIFIVFTVLVCCKVHKYLVVALKM